MAKPTDTHEVLLNNNKKKNIHFTCFSGWEYNFVMVGSCAMPNDNIFEVVNYMFIID